MRFIPGLFVVLAFLASPVLAKNVPVTREQQRNLGIDTAPVQTVTEHPVATLPATVGPARDSRFVLVVPFSGTVTDISALEGQYVTRGTRLGTIFSRDLLAVQSQLAQVQAELNLAATAAERTKLLAEEGIVAVARAQESEARLAALRAQLDEQRHILNTVQVDRARPGYYVLAAPAAGRIARIDVEPGASLQAMATAMLIDKADKVWLEAQLPADLIAQVKVGAAVAAGSARGKVIAVGMSVDPKTRSVILRAEFPASADLIPGSTIGMTAVAASQKAGLSVPSAAVVRVQGKDTVFVATESGFQSTAVNVLGSASNATAISGEIRPGQRVAVAGLSELKVLVERD